MDWFERLTGFAETSYEETRGRLSVEGSELRSQVNGRSYAIGELEVVSLDTLRHRAALHGDAHGALSVRNIGGDVRQMHLAAEYCGALFQVASQFNLLEMVSPRVTPEDGVTRYAHDHTQGPACAIAAGAATIYRNYFVPVQGGVGQTAERQINCLAAVGEALAQGLARPVEHLWKMSNGYALCHPDGLEAINAYLSDLDDNAIDALRGRLQIGLHWNVEVTDAAPKRQIVSQAFCSALPVAYRDIHWYMWRRLGTLVLEAAYEATVLAAILNARMGMSNIVLLTRLGGGAFGNEDEWIDAAMRRALRIVRNVSLDVRLVSFGSPNASMLETERMFS